jgi:hypothetical protein
LDLDINSNRRTDDNISRIAPPVPADHPEKIRLPHSFFRPGTSAPLRQRSASGRPPHRPIVGPSLSLACANFGCRHYFDQLARFATLRTGGSLLSASGTRNASRDAFGEIARQPRIEPRIERHIGGALRARQQQGSRAHAEIAGMRPAAHALS